MTDMSQPPMSSFKSKPGDSRSRAPRFLTNGELLVRAQTIGTSAVYSLTTDNVSSTGLLLTWLNKSRAPFTTNTILEMTIDPNSDLLGQPLSCLGKVIRRDDGTNRPKFGVQIVQMDGSDIIAWEGCVSSLEQKFKRMVPRGTEETKPDDQPK